MSREARGRAERRATDYDIAKQAGELQARLS